MSSPLNLSPSNSFETPSQYKLSSELVDFVPVRTSSENGVLVEPSEFEQALQQGRSSLQQALSSVDCNTLSRLSLTYFEMTENVLRLCILLIQNSHHARLVYEPMHEFLDNDFNSDAYSLSLSQCILAYNMFNEFYHAENPFVSPDSLGGLRNSVQQLKLDLARHSKKLRSKLHNVCTFTPLSMGKRARSSLSLIDAAERDVYILLNNMDTIERMMVRLYANIDDDKNLSNVGLERGVDQYVIQEVLKQFRRNRLNFNQVLVDFELYSLLTISATYRMRSQLLENIVKQPN